MTIVAPPLPRTSGERLRWAVVDAWTNTRRDLAHWVHQPCAVIVGLLFPIMMLVMFGYLLGGAIFVPGGQCCWWPSSRRSRCIATSG